MDELQVLAKNIMARKRRRMLEEIDPSILTEIAVGNFIPRDAYQFDVSLLHPSKFQPLALNPVVSRMIRAPEVNIKKGQKYITLGGKQVKVNHGFSFGNGIIFIYDSGAGIKYRQADTGEVMRNHTWAYTYMHGEYAFDWFPGCSRGFKLYLRGELAASGDFQTDPKDCWIGTRNEGGDLVVTRNHARTDVGLNIYVTPFAGWRNLREKIEGTRSTLLVEIEDGDSSWQYTLEATTSTVLYEFSNGSIIWWEYTPKQGNRMTAQLFGRERDLVKNMNIPDELERIVLDFLLPF